VATEVAILIFCGIEFQSTEEDMRNVEWYSSVRERRMRSWLSPRVGLMRELRLEVLK